MKKICTVASVDVRNNFAEIPGKRFTVEYENGIFYSEGEEIFDLRDYDEEGKVILPSDSDIIEFAYTYDHPENGFTLLDCIDIMDGKLLDSYSEINELGLDF